MEDYLTKVSIGFIIAIVSSIITTKIALNKFYSEKWWARKEQAYIEIIDALYDLIQFCEIKKEDYGDGTNIHPDKMKEITQKYTEGYWKIKKSTDIGSFVISEEAKTVLKNLRDKPKLDWNTNPSFEIFEADFNSYQEALERIVAVSKKDLKV